MKIYYISPSTIPARSANSIHVVNMCEGLTQLDHSVVLFVHSEVSDSFGVIKQFYGVANERIQTVPYISKRARGTELGIAIIATLYYIKDLIKGDPPRNIISRNLYAAVFLGLIFRKKLVYESHSPERGIRKTLQRLLLLSNNIETVVISKALRKAISDLHVITNERIQVLHDAARSGQSRMNAYERHRVQLELLGAEIDLAKYENVVGYFGHLYPGRGIEIIEGLAQQNNNDVFVVYGGNENEISQYKKKNTSKNLLFMGYLSPTNVSKSMAMMDTLLMPYQKSVSVGLDGVDTAQWMSPIKMFEYMSVGVPIISSDLPVLKEVLVDGKNCLLAEPHNIECWSNALRRILDSPELKELLGTNAHDEYQREFTWKIRAKRILKLLGSPRVIW
jgi:glycosyltransferase involved in cell wall biosynthesis